MVAWIRPLPALALALALAGCEQGGASPAAGSGKVAAGPAGEVVHVEGAVTAARPGEAPRALEVGSPVSADDTISVPMSAEISILLAHNKVQWDIGSGQSYRVDQSRAWTAKAGSGSALDEKGDLGTASAGRHGEREAGETAATARAEVAPPEAETAEPAVAVAPPPEKPTAAVRRRPPTGDSAPEAPRETLRGKALGMSPGDSALLGDTGGGGAAAGGKPESKSVTAPVAPRIALAVTLGEIKVRGARAQADIATVFGSFSAAACGVSQTGAVVLRFEIGADGAVLKPRVTGPQALVAEVRGCVTSAARKLRFPVAASGNTWVEREIRFGAKTK